MGFETNAGWDTGQQLYNLDTGVFETPVIAPNHPSDTPEYASPDQVGADTVKRMFFYWDTTVGTFSWNRYLVPSSLTDIKDVFLTMETSDPDPIWGLHSTSNSLRWWYVRANMGTGRIQFDMAGNIGGVRGWVDYT